MSKSVAWELKSAIIPKTSEDLKKILLENRNINQEHDEALFFETSVEKIMPEIKKLFDEDAVSEIIAIIKNAINNNVPIVIHGDYDVDGISATATLWETIYHDLHYKNVMPFIPHRAHHGYGVSQESLDDILSQTKQKNAVVITVDCGITSREAIEYGKGHGLSFIVTDHHSIQEGKVPESVPKMHTYSLCGAGIAWALSVMLREEFNPQASIFQGIDLVALATLADIQPVVGLNRVLIKEGLRQLSQTKREGFRQLYQIAGIEDKEIGTYEVGWVIAPRLNAMGRLENAMESLRLVCTLDPDRARSIAQKMHETNEERQLLTQQSIEEAITLIEKEKWQDDLFLVVNSEHWHEGILGLIAGKLAERYHVPVIALGKGESVYKGSARSISGFNVVDAIKAHENLVEEAGGHEMAAGLSISEENIAQFRLMLREYAAVQFNHERPPKIYIAETELPSSLFTFETADMIESMAPYGVGNPKPLFISHQLIVTNNKVIGAKSNHLKLQLQTNDGGSVEAIGFGLGGWSEKLKLGQSVSVLYSLEINEFRGNRTIQLNLKAIDSGTATGRE
ncbi:single-stranded-DNA-specific exonuclease RecJ [candidate division WWE3 bacterium]|uniref:Single-stranded-DNA-specific exonuclease RecJ n=1 Tax=candidate division WWE3 bacterium TaxID=2053526 RepID=A0A955RQ76_UNCKA|nr:single-stranded-DNA-specific exonuclease RecJ [candidate division WWE3 bacterium]